MAFKILGVHPIDADEPCHLIEAQLSNSDDFDWGAVTQEIASQPRSDWQSPWDERPIDDTETRWVFFFHYLDPKKPLITPGGNVTLPKPTPIPTHLASIEYESP